MNQQVPLAPRDQPMNAVIVEGIKVLANLANLKKMDIGAKKAKGG